MSFLEFAPVSPDIFLAALLIAFLRICDVSLGTLRTVMITRGYKNRAALLGFVEVTIWVLAISQVASDLGNLWLVLAYSGGFAAGTYIGMWIEQRLALGDVAVAVFSVDQSTRIVQMLRQRGLRVIESQGNAADGTIVMASAIVPRRHFRGIERAIRRIDRGAYIIVDDVRVAAGAAAVIK